MQAEAKHTGNAIQKQKQDGPCQTDNGEGRSHTHGRGESKVNDGPRQREEVHCEICGTVWQCARFVMIRAGSVEIVLFADFVQII